MVNPYFGQNFFSFFLIFVQRLFGLLTGRVSLQSLASDELQIFVLIAIATSGALVGTFLILKRIVMLANALSHTILLGIVSVYLLLPVDPSTPLSMTTLLIAALLTGVATTFFTEFLSKITKLQEDASIGLSFTLLFALGIVLVTLFSRNIHIGTELVMGNADALQKSDLTDALSILGINLCIFLFLFHGFKITTFDPQLAKMFGFSHGFFNYLLMIQTSATAIGGFRAVGVLMILAFFVIPSLTARLFTHKLSTLLWLSIFIGAVATLVGVALSRHILTYFGVGLSTGGIVVTTLGAVYLLSVIFTRYNGKKIEIKV